MESLSTQTITRFFEKVIEVYEGELEISFSKLYNELMESYLDESVGWTDASREQQEEAVENYKWHLLCEYRGDFDKETLDELWDESIEETSTQNGDKVQNNGDKVQE